MAIVGKLESLEHVFNRNNALLNLYDWLKGCVDGEWQQVKYFEDCTCVSLGDGISVRYQIYKLKDMKKGFFESHRDYVDFQLTISGNECFMIGDIGDFKVKVPYDESRDVAQYHFRKTSHRILSHSRDLCIFTPCDVHAGGLFHACFTARKVHKVVAKVPVDLFNS